MHAGKGIYRNRRYYTSPELVAAGFLRRRAKGKQRRVMVADHRGTTNFIYWVRGPQDLVKCELIAKQKVALGNKTAAEAEAHVEALAPVSKREQLRLVNKAAHEQAPESRPDANRLSRAAKKSAVTKDKKRIDAVTAAARALGAKRDAHARFPNDVPKPDPRQSMPVVTRPVDSFSEAVAQSLAERIGRRRADSNEKV